MTALPPPLPRSVALVIARIEAHVYRVPLAKPVQLSTRTVQSRDWLVVRVTAKDGTIGTGFSFAGYNGGEEILEPIVHRLAPALFAAPLLTPEGLWAHMNAANMQSRTQRSDRALSALDIALHDASARSAGISLADYLGSHRTLPLRTYVGAGYYDPDGVEAEVVALQNLLAATTATEIKVKVGRHDLMRERRRLALFKAVMTDNHSVSIDANGIFQEIEPAARLVDALNEITPIDMFEDAFPDTRLDLYGALRKLRGGIAISTGELFTNEAMFHAALAQGAVDVLQVDVTACGGITAARRLAEKSSTTGIPLESHWFPELHRQIAGSHDAWRRVEVFVDSSIINFGQIAHCSPRDHGHGITISAEHCNHYSVAAISAEP